MSNTVPAAERRAVDVCGCDEYRHSGVRAVLGGIVDAELPVGYFHGVFVSNVLEHLPSQDAVDAALARLGESLAVGGRIAVMGPNFWYCTRGYMTAPTTRLLTHVAVAEHLYAAGFDVTEVIASFLPYSFRGRLPASPRLTRTYLRCPMLWRVLGKQFLILGVKPG